MSHSLGFSPESGSFSPLLNFIKRMRSKTFSSGEALKCFDSPRFHHWDPDSGDGFSSAQKPTGAIAKAAIARKTINHILII
jgi:hypothetical protein